MTFDFSSSDSFRVKSLSKLGVDAVSSAVICCCICIADPMSGVRSPFLLQFSHGSGQSVKFTVFVYNCDLAQRTMY